MAVTFRDIVPAQQPELLASGFQFTEGPVWHPQGFLLFSDIPADTIYRYVPDRGVQRFIHPSHNSNGLTYDRAGRLLACEHSGRRLSRMDESGTMRPLVETYDGKRLNSPNDITVHSSGSIFFTDPPYGIDPDPGELGFNGIYRLDPSGLISLLNDELVRPNGLAFNPDESLLYVADSRARQVRSFTVNQDLSLGWHSLFVDMDVREPGNPDGMKGGHLRQRVMLPRQPGFGSWNLRAITWGPSSSRNSRRTSLLADWDGDSFTRLPGRASTASGSTFRE